MKQKEKLTVKNISHLTMKVTKREIERILWLFSGEKRVREKKIKGSIMNEIEL